MKLMEADALTKWCPFARLYVYQVPTATAEEGRMAPPATGGPANRFMGATETDTNPESCRCLASGCMAWAWTGPERVYGCCALAHERN